MSRLILLAGGLLAVLVIVSCSGPDEFGDSPSTPSPVTPTSIATPDEAPEVSPTSDASPTSAESDETPEPTSSPEPEASPTATTEPTEEPTPTEEAEPTATHMPVSAMEALPQLEELTEGGYVVADQGDRTAEQLARAYTDSAAHLARLEEWGFRQHAFREFTRNEAEGDDPLPTYVLATVNVYGSPEQADMALQWLEEFQVSQGAMLVDPPEIADSAVALTVSTSQGDPTASVYFRSESRVFIYYAQSNDPLPEVVAIAERVFERLNPDGDIARIGWSS